MILIANRELSFVVAGVSEPAERACAAEPAAEPDADPATEPDADPEPEPDPVQGAEPAAEPEPEPAAEPEPEPEPEPGADADPEPAVVGDAGCASARPQATASTTAAARTIARIVTGALR